ncbi:MAG: serine/threonine-protein kinase, partial [Isosphaeraceae bacterium]
MFDSERMNRGERPEGTGSWRPLAASTAEGLDTDPPTVRSGNSAGSVGTGSSVTRRKGGALPLPGSGDQIDTFSLEEVIGAGGMGAVYRALDIRLDRRVALKILPPEQGYDAETVQRFYQEARAAARLDHENIARVFTIGHDGQYHYIAFEYIEGTNVRLRVAEQGPLPVGEAINYTLQIANALVHAAERGVVHRDIKPSNIIITPQGRAKLVDMGLARQFERGGGVDDGLTQSGMTLGTFDYISPEQARDPRNVDVRSDLYSLGCTLFHMLTGRPPFPDGTVLQKLIQHQEEPAPDVRILNPGVPADLAAILLKLMAKDRDRRYQTPEQLARDLLTVAGALGLRSVSPEGLIWMAGDSQVSWDRHLVWAVPTLTLALVVLALVWWGQPTSEITVATPLIEAIAPPPPPRVAPAVPDVADEPRHVDPIESTPRVVAEAGAVEAVPTPARDFTLRAGDDLSAVLASAPSGSIVTLGDDGPFDLRPTAIDRKDADRMAGRDLTLRASAGVRPILRVARDSDAVDGADAALVRVVGGRVVLEGLEFALDPGDREGSLAAVFAEDADLTVRRCLFRRIGPPTVGGRVAALHLRAHPGADLEDRPAPTRVVASHFDGGQTGIQARGPVAVEVVDTTFGPGGPAVSFDQESSLNAGLARLGLRHVSIMAGDGPVVRFVRTPAVVRIDDSVVSSTGTGRPILVATDDPDRLDWLGRGNLYGAFDVYLQPTRTLTGRDPIRGFDEWSDGPSGPREADSVADDEPVWAETNLLAALARNDPSAAFAPTLEADLDVVDPGVRRGPFGVIAHPPESLARVAEIERPARVRPLVEPPTPTVQALLAEPPNRSMAVEPAPESRPVPMVVEVPPMPAVVANPERDQDVPD